MSTIDVALLAELMDGMPLLADPDAYVEIAGALEAAGYEVTVDCKTELFFGADGMACPLLKVRPKVAAHA